MEIKEDDKHICAHLKPLWVVNTKESISSDHSTTEIASDIGDKSS